VKDIHVLLLALPAIVLLGFTIYRKSIHEGMSKEHAVTAGLIYGALTAGLFVLAYFAKFVATGSPA